MIDNPNGNRLYTIIKQAAKAVIENSKPVVICQGRIISEKHIKIEITSQELILDSDFFIFPANFGKLEIGDKLLLIREQGGQNYYVMNRL